MNRKNRCNYTGPGRIEKPEPTHIISHLNGWAVRANNSVIHINPHEEEITLEFTFPNGSSVVIMMSSEDAYNISGEMEKAAELSQFGYCDCVPRSEFN